MTTVRGSGTGGQQVLASLRGLARSVAIIVAVVAASILVAMALRSDDNHLDVVIKVKLGGAPGRPTTDADGDAWVPIRGTNQVAHVDIDEGVAFASLDVPKPGVDTADPVAAAADGMGTVWVVARGTGQVHRLAPVGLPPVDVGNAPVDIAIDPRGIAAGGAWVLHCECSNGGSSRVTHIDGAGRPDKLKDQLAVGDYASAIAAYGDAVWVTSNDGVQRIDVGNPTRRNKAFGVAGVPTDVVVDESGVWVSASNRAFKTNQVAHFEPGAEEALYYPVGVQPVSLALGDGYLWVAHQSDSSLRLLTTSTGETVGKRVFGPDSTASKANQGNGVSIGDPVTWFTNTERQMLYGVLP